MRIVRCEILAGLVGHACFATARGVADRAALTAAIELSRSTAERVSYRRRIGLLEAS